MTEVDRARTCRRMLPFALSAVIAACTPFNAPAPIGTVMTISANPTTISANSGQATVTVELFKVDGSSVLDGTSVSFTTTLGQIPPRAETVGGRAVVTLFAGNQRGAATVTARAGVDNSSQGAGNNLLEGTVGIEIGVGAGSISLNARPANLPPGGGTTTLRATVLDPTGVPVGQLPVVFETTAGTFSPANTTVNTNGSGVAKIDLRTDRSATVTARVQNLVATRTIPLDEDQPPVAVMTFSPASPAINELVEFSALGSSDDGAIVAYRWDLGNGRTATGTTATESYRTANTYVVSLRVEDDSGQIATTSQSVVVLAGEPPSPAFVFTPSPATAGTELRFNASSSISPNGEIVRYAWEWGDGASPVVSSSATARHTFESAGSFLVRLTVRDDQGLEASILQTVIVS
jgi:PKD repeat protein